MEVKRSWARVQAETNAAGRREAQGQGWEAGLQTCRNMHACMHGWGGAGAPCTHACMGGLQTERGRTMEKLNAKAMVPIDVSMPNTCGHEGRLRAASEAARVGGAAPGWL